MSLTRSAALALYVPHPYLSLSLTLPSSQPNKQTSPLLRLPNELLNQIMDSALSIGTIYVNLSTGRRQQAPRFQYVDGGIAYPLTQLLGSTRACKWLHECYGSRVCALNTFELYVADMDAFTHVLPVEYFPLVREMRIERGFRWCVEAWDDGFLDLAVFGSLRRVRLVVTGDRDYSDVPGVIREKLRRCTGMEVVFELEVVKKGDVADVAAGRRRQFA